jgi:ammonium transporter Rh
VLISLSCLIGKVTFPQMYLLTILEVIFYGLNRSMILGVMQAMDAGGAMTIHMFGAYFGLTCSFFFKPKRAIQDEFDQGKGHYNS